MRKTRKNRNTPELIIKKSLEMFNKQGERNVTTNHIAQQLDLSTGNLYYHYGSKDEIILELARRYTNEFNEIIQRSLSNNVEFGSIIQLLEDIIGLRWDYRFIMHGKFGMFPFNENIKSTYFATEHSNIELPISRFFQKLYDFGIFNIQQQDLDLLARQFSLLQEAWLSMQILNMPTRPSTEIISAGRHYMLKFIYPTLNKEWQCKCDSVFLAEPPSTATLFTSPQ